MRPHTKGTPYGFRGRHRRAYPCLPRGHHRDGAPENLRYFPDPDASWGWDKDLEKYYFCYTLFQLPCYNSELRTDLPLSYVLPAQGGMIRSIIPPTGFLRTGGYEPSSTSTTNAAGQKQFLIPSPLTKMGLPYVRKTCA